MSDPFKDVAENAVGEPSSEWVFWNKEIRLALKRENKFREQAKAVLELYEAQKSADNNFNILYANTETLLPANYNQLPRPMVERRFKDSDPLGQQVSTALERTLVYLVDSPDAEYEKYDDLFRQAVLGALVPGRGVTWWSYDPKIEGAEASVEDGKGEEALEGEGPAAVAASESDTGTVLPKIGEKVTWETICGEVVEYDKFLCGYGKRWKHIPWIAREHCMTKEDAEENFGKEIAETLEYLEDAKDGERADKGSGEDGKDNLKNQGTTKTAVVYEVWWKTRKQVVFYAPSRRLGLCGDPIDDPYKLTGFYPVEEPLQFLKKLTTVVPTPIYKAYEPQAKELNRISMRINRIINAMKVRGFYDGSVQGLSELLNKDDNTLIPAKNIPAMKEGAGANLSNSIWFMPLDMLVATVKELYNAREQTKQVIYEITGIADIMRGSTQVSETATAQSLKDKWGGLRLQSMQGAVQAYIRGCLRIVAELAGRHFDIQTFVGMTNLDYATPEQLQQAQATMQAVQQALMQMPPQQPSMGPGAPPAAPGQPQVPAPPPLPPQLQQAAEQAQAVLAKPQWQPVIDVLRDNIQRGYKVDIETNSTIANTSAEDQDNINKAMTAIGAAMQQFIPAVQVGIMTMPALKEILLSMARRFEFGRQVETAIEQMPDQLPQPQMTPEMQKAQQDVQQREEKVQQDEQAVQKGQADIDMKAKEVQMQIKAAQDEMKLEQEAAMQKQELSQQKFLMEVEKANMRGQMQRDKQINKMSMNQAAHEQKVDLRLSAHEQAMQQTAAQSEMKHQAIAAKSEQKQQAAAAKTKA